MKFAVLKAGQENLNGRIYTKESLEQAVASFNDLQKSGLPMFGQVGYPDGQFGLFDLSKASHRITEVVNDGDTLYANLEFLNTPAGDQARQLVDNCVLRPRSMGTVNEDKTVNVSKVFTYDLIPKEEDSFKGILS
jgi:hypothetical protein